MFENFVFAVLIIPVLIVFFALIINPLMVFGWIKILFTKLPKIIFQFVCKNWFQVICICILIYICYLLYDISFQVGIIKYNLKILTR